MLPPAAADPYTDFTCVGEHECDATLNVPYAPPVDVRLNCVSDLKKFAASVDSKMSSPNVDIQCVNPPTVGGGYATAKCEYPPIKVGPVKKFNVKVKVICNPPS